MRIVPVVLAALAPAVALAAPRVGVVVVAHEGVNDEKTDEIAYDLAASVATQIEGEAIAGATVRERLPAGAIAEGCEEQPQCGRQLAAKLKTDEALLLSIHVAGKTTVVRCYRVPRDEAKAPSDRTLRLMGSRAKRAGELMEVVSALYPSGSVTEFASPPEAEEPPPPRARTREKPALIPGDRPEPEPEHKSGSKKGLWIGVGVAAGVVVVALGLTIGLALGLERAPTGPSVALP